MNLFDLNDPCDLSYCVTYRTNFTILARHTEVLSFIFDLIVFPVELFCIDKL